MWQILKYDADQDPFFNDGIQNNCLLGTVGKDNGYKKMRCEHQVFRMPRGHFQVFTLGATDPNSLAALSKNRLEIENLQNLY